MELKTAREIIGVSEDFTYDELMEKYYALTEERLPRDELSKIHDAYNILLEHLKEQEPEPSFREKLSNFIYHHKWHLVIGSFLAIIFGLFAYTMIQGQIEKAREAKLPPPEIELMLFGEYYENADLSPIEDRIFKMFPSWERLNTELVYAPKEPSSQYDIAALQKSVAVLAVERPDVYIFDYAQFDKFRDQSGFLPLDDYLKDKEDIKHRFFEYTALDTDERGIYAIDLTGHSFFEDAEFSGHEYVYAIRDKTEQKENAVDFLLKLLEEFE